MADCLRFVGAGMRDPVPLVYNALMRER